jgi:hypothetical protein
MRTSLLMAGLALSSIVGLSGCELKKAPVKATTSADPHAGHDHSAPGPNGGHVEAFDKSDLHFEWSDNDDSHTLSIYLDQIVSKGGNVGSVKIDVISGDTKKTFTLEKDEKAKIAGSVYFIASEELLGMVDASGTDTKGVHSKLIAVIDGKEQTCLLKHDDGHKH